MMINRCGKCEACEYVKATSQLVTPNPPFTHANQADVDLWNRALKENPCRLKPNPYASIADVISELNRICVESVDYGEIADMVAFLEVENERQS